jgi:drug/metabolite transporter (DMT)-like permease
LVILLLILTTLLWGSTPILEKMDLVKVDSLIGVTLRSSIVTAGLFLLTFLLGKGRALIELDGERGRGRGKDGGEYEETEKNESLEGSFEKEKY